MTFFVYCLARKPMLHRACFALLLLLFSLIGCTPAPRARPAAVAQTAPSELHSPYDDSTLHGARLPVLMPYNRLIAPAGPTVAYGDPNLENHSLDAQLIPETNLLAVEDRYGIALLDTVQRQVAARWTYAADKRYRGAMSVYSGLKVVREGDEAHIFWTAANGGTRQSFVLEAVYAGGRLSIRRALEFAAAGAPLALPNDLALTTENGRPYLYVVLNGNNQVVKLDRTTGQPVWTQAVGVAPYGLAVAENKVFVSNWAGPLPPDTLHQETAGVPYGRAYIAPRTGATARGTVSVLAVADGRPLAEIEVGLHPSAVLASPDGQRVFVANGNSDAVSVLDVRELRVSETIPVHLLAEAADTAAFVGDSPNALALDAAGTTLYVANGLDNAVAVVALGQVSAPAGAPGPSRIQGFIPTEAYPAGLALGRNTLFVTNLEGEGARVSSDDIRVAGGTVDELLGINFPAYNSHHQRATVSMIPLPTAAQLVQQTAAVRLLNFSFRKALARQQPRPGVAPQPLPERIGEPSVFQHVVYIIKENRTYDQVFGDIATGRGEPRLCVFGDSITPNQHQLAREFVLLDNYYASGKSSAEGHQWADAAMVTDYVEKSVRAWFRSYPHVQYDALVYSAPGYLWNHAADHGKTVRIYGEACLPHYDNSLTWSAIYDNYRAGKPFEFTNYSTISRVRPLLSPTFPGSDDLRITDQLRADAFIKELEDYEKAPGDALPNLSIIALATDHTIGTRPGFPTPQAMVADNDLALGRIVEALSRSRFWQNTVVFVTEDDSQAGWDHVSAYRTTGQVLSAYSRLGRPVSTNYNQTCMVRSIEQILGLPPMNTIDATALPMFDCFAARPTTLQPFRHLPNRVVLNTMNPPLSKLTGAARRFGRLSLLPEFDHIDSGRDGLMNRIIWFATKGKAAYPAALAGKEDDDDDD